MLFYLLQLHFPRRDLQNYSNQQLTPSLEVTHQATGKVTRMSLAAKCADENSPAMDVIGQAIISILLWPITMYVEAKIL